MYSVTIKKRMKLVFNKELFNTTCNKSLSKMKKNQSLSIDCVFVCVCECVFLFESLGCN